VVASILRELSAAAPKVYTRAEALESVARGVKNPDILVFATHGFFLPLRTPQPVQPQVAAPNAARLDQSAPGTRSSNLVKHVPPGYQALDVIDNPYFRCGLLLAGANSHDKWGEVRSADGILTGLEVSMMDLRGTKLVVLSACETGLGDPAVGEG